MLRDYLHKPQRGLWEALAAAAFVADRRNGVMHFTDSVYARVIDDDDDELLPPAELPKPSHELLTLTRAALNVMLERAIESREEGQWGPTALAVKMALTQEAHS